MTTTTVTTAAEAAANWWAEQVGAPTYRMVRDSDPREERVNADMASMMQTLIADRHPVDVDAGAKFAKTLAKTITKQLKRMADGGFHGISLGVDYGPDRDLGEAAEAAGIHLSRFPWKTHMRVTPEYVTAALGYGARDVLIWSAPGWQRPPCGHHRYINDDATDDVCTLPRYHAEECGSWRLDPARCKVCGGSYVDHYGNAGFERRRSSGDWHSYTPDGAS